MKGSSESQERVQIESGKGTERVKIGSSKSQGRVQKDSGQNSESQERIRRKFREGPENQETIQSVRKVFSVSHYRVQRES